MPSTSFSEKASEVMQKHFRSVTLKLRKAKARAVKLRNTQNLYNIEKEARKATKTSYKCSLLDRLMSLNAHLGP